MSLHHTIRETGVIEYPVPGDNTTLHQCSDGEGGTCYRASCVACGYRSVIFDLPSPARAACIQHASGRRHALATAYYSTRKGPR